MLQAARVAPRVLSVSLALGALSCDGEAWEPTRPIRIAAEDGTLGESVTRVTDAMEPSITYVTAAVNVTDPPADASDPRVVSQTLEFPRAGEYQIYARLRIGPGAGNDDSFFVFLPNDEGGTWQVVNAISGYDVAGNPTHRPQARTVVGFNLEVRPVIEWVLVQKRAFSVEEAASRFPPFTREHLFELFGWLSHAALIRPIPAPEWDAP